MPRPVLQYCSLPFSWHRIRYPSILLQVAARRLCPNRTRMHAALCREAGRLVSRPRRVKSQAVASRPAESRICVLLHFRSACNVLAALQQRRGLPCSALKATRSSVIRPHSVAPRRRVVCGRVAWASRAGGNPVAPAPLRTPSAGFPAVGKRAPLGPEGRPQPSSEGGGDTLRRQDSPRGVSFPVKRSCMASCLACVRLTRFHGAQAYSG